MRRVAGGLPATHRLDLLPPCRRFLYDERGSQLYEQITALPEYYPYETGRQRGGGCCGLVLAGRGSSRGSICGWVCTVTTHPATAAAAPLLPPLPPAEKRLLAQHAAAIASQFPAGSLVVELGCGDSTKTALLLQALVDRWGWAGSVV